jgi:hypothetical protein
MAKNRERRLKLQAKYRNMTYSMKTVPELKLSGVWLEAVGFRAGGYVSILIEENQLIIRPL